MRFKQIILTLMTAQAIWAAPPSFDTVPGTVIHHSPASSRIFLGCPGIVIIDDGVYLAKHSEFGPGSTEWEAAITQVYRSDDAGKSWRRISKVEGLFWASIFTHQDAVYLFGTDRHHGNTVIMRSDDEGKTWTKPVDGNSGLLLEGPYHTAPVPVLIHDGRIWRAMEDAEGTKTGPVGPWGGPKYGTFMMSAPVDSDLLNRQNWTLSNIIRRNSAWKDEKTRAWLEGNAVLTPEGGVACILRVNFERGPGILTKGGVAAMVQISDDGKTATFDPATGFIEFPGGDKKFTIRYDERSGKYWTLTNYVPPRHQGRTHADMTRNTAVLACSEDLRNWQIRATVLYHPDVKKHGFQYIDWLFEGDDIIAVSRTAYEDGLGGAHSAHNNNFLTFHRIKGFRHPTSN